MDPQTDDNLQVVMARAEPRLIPVGSSVVREVTERYRPLLSLHGHVHQSPRPQDEKDAVHQPGSDHHTGRISGCPLRLRDEGVVHERVDG